MFIPSINKESKIKREEHLEYIVDSRYPTVARYEKE